MFGSDPWIVLPPSATKELLEKSDDEVNADVIHDEQIQRKYTQGQIGLHLTAHGFHRDVVRRQLTRKLPLLTSDVYDELRVGFGTYWGRDSDSLRRINVYRTCTQIVSRAANRVFVGKQLCMAIPLSSASILADNCTGANEDFLEHARLYAEGVFKGGALINLLPKLLRPVIAPLITYPNRKNKRIYLEACLPIVKDRLHHTMRKRDNADYQWTPPVSM